MNILRTMIQMHHNIAIVRPNPYYENDNAESIAVIICILLIHSRINPPDKNNYVALSNNGVALVFFNMLFF